jgi:lysozyme
MLFTFRVLASLALAPVLLVAFAAGDDARSGGLADKKPHNGVAAAHSMPIQGIDVSYWQGDIDWLKVREAGVHFAFIKATEGGDHLDPKFLENWEGAKRVGIARGAYHFIYWCRC